MACEPEPQTLIKVCKRALRPMRRQMEYARKILVLWSFRRFVDALRVAHVLPQPAAAGSPLHLLIVNLTPHLGDTIMQMPMIEALRSSHPHARIDYAVEESAAQLLRGMSELDHVYGLKLGRVPPLGLRPALRRGLLVVREYWKQMRSCAPTVCLLPRWGDDLFRSDVLAYLTGAPRRIGFSWRVMPGAPPAPYRDAFLTSAMGGGNAQHEPLRFCALASDAGLIPPASLDGLSNRVVPSLQHMSAIQDWPRLAERLGIDTDAPFVVIAPGASHPKKIWSLQRWAGVMTALRRRGLAVVLLSGASDADVARTLQTHSGAWATVVAGQTTLIESLTLIARATLFLGSDSGPGHMAGALGIPTVTLFIASPTTSPDDAYSPARNRPLGPYVATCQPSHNRAPCQGACMAESNHCIDLIDVHDVLEAADSLLAHKREGRDSTL